MDIRVLLPSLWVSALKRIHLFNICLINTYCVLSAFLGTEDIAVKEKKQ